MIRNKTTRKPRLDRGPLRLLFVITSMPVGGAETLLVNLIRRLDRERFLPELCCLKELGPLGETIANEIPTHSKLLRDKFDWRVLLRLRRLMRQQRVDGIITVGAGDKMFWGRLSAWFEDVPVILSALHSTGWPDTVGRLNRMLTPLTDGFIAVAETHGRFLARNLRFPERKIHVVPNGVDVARFRSLPDSGIALRQQLKIPLAAPVCGIVAALRPEKNHSLFLRAAREVAQSTPDARFVIVGDGPEREKLELSARDAGLAGRVHFAGSRADIPQVLSALDVFALTSHNEANPVSILEAMACEVPVVSTRVGSVADTVREAQTGFLVEPGDAQGLASAWRRLFEDRPLARKLGTAGREFVVGHASLERMVEGYQTLIETIYDAKWPSRPLGESPPALATTN